MVNVVYSNIISLQTVFDCLFGKVVCVPFSIKTFFFRKRNNLAVNNQAGRTIVKMSPRKWELINPQNVHDRNVN